MPSTPDAISLRALPIHLSFSIFAAASIILYLVTHFLIPFLAQITGMEAIFFWFVAGGVLVFAPLLIAAWVMLKREGHWAVPGLWRERLRFKPLTASDVKWSLCAVLIIALCSAAIMYVLEIISGPMETQPSFMHLERISTGRYWLLAVWLPFWILNIMGEEILWRGVLLPRQELTHGNNAWFFHGLGWSLFHLAFGWKLLLTMLPILFIESYVVQRTANSWNGVIIHAGINGPAFLAIALGLI